MYSSLFPEKNTYPFVTRCEQANQFDQKTNSKGYMLLQGMFCAPVSLDTVR